ncbi:MAG: hypothetical protein F4207_04730 [Gemmatimonadetes bacterium]|nr:hypothetical protein [Gemmatimonadota bacterium]
MQQYVVTGGRDLVSHTGDFTAPTTNRTTWITYADDPLMRAATVTTPGRSASSSLCYGKGDLTRVSHKNHYESVTDELGKRVTSNFDRWGAVSRRHCRLRRRFREHWERAGLDINDPAYGRWVSGSPQGRHQNWSRAFNDAWRGFFDKFPDATREQILKHMNDLRKSGDFE